MNRRGDALGDIRNFSQLQGKHRRQVERTPNTHVTLEFALRSLLDGIYSSIVRHRIWRSQERRPVVSLSSNTARVFASRVARTPLLEPPARFATCRTAIYIGELLSVTNQPRLIW